jgi:hypothetical protein
LSIFLRAILTNGSKVKNGEFFFFFFFALFCSDCFCAAHGQNIGLTLNRFVAQSQGGADPKQKEAAFVTNSQQAAKSIQQMMVVLKGSSPFFSVCLPVFLTSCVVCKDARTNVADPNKVCDKALALGSKITTMVIAFIKTVKQVSLSEEGAAQHHVIQLVPSDATKVLLSCCCFGVCHSPKSKDP